MKIKIATDFTRSPGPRYIYEGEFSGELFRKTILFPKLTEAIEKNSALTVDLDDTSGYGTSFLEESFGGLIRTENIPLSLIKNHINFVSHEEEDWIEDINQYLADAEHEKTAAQTI